MSLSLQKIATVEFLRGFAVVLIKDGLSVFVSIWGKGFGGIL